MTKFLITGATGLIGSHLLRCLGTDDTVYALSRSGPVPGATHTLQVDLGKAWSTEVLPRGIDVLVHLAQSEHYRDFPMHSEDVFTVNTLSTVKLLEYARATGIPKFILASSGGVYSPSPGTCSEDAEIVANGKAGFYIGTRLCSELLSDCYQGFMDVVCLRFFFVYGPGQSAHMLIPRLFGAVREGRAVTLDGESGLHLNPVYVDDAVQSVRQAVVLKGSHKVNVAGPTVISLRELAEEIGRLVGKAPAFEVKSAAAPRDIVASIDRMRALLWEPKVACREGLATSIGCSTGV